LEAVVRLRGACLLASAAAGCGTIGRPVDYCAAEKSKDVVAGNADDVADLVVTAYRKKRCGT
jgi:hypothetical protein